MRVLIVEYSRIFQRVFGDIFLRLNYEVSIASNLAEALKLIKNSTFDLLCVGNELNDGFGYELAQRCREEKLVADATSIFLTTSNTITNDFLNKMLSVGVTEVLSKKNIEIIYDQIEKYAMSRMTKKFTAGKILYIEDDLEQSKIVILQLESIGIEVTHLTGTEDVELLLQQTDYDAIICDVIVEGTLSTLSLVQTIRSYQSLLSSIPIIIVTASDNLSRRLEFYRLGISDYFIKPFLTEEFLLRIKNHVLVRQLSLLATQQNTRIEWYQTHDELTTCLKQSAFEEHAAQFVNDAMLKNQPVAVIGFDLDNLQEIRDRDGNCQVDEILAEIGQMLMSLNSSMQLITRTGHGEFIIMMSPGSQSSIQNLIERIQSELNLLTKLDINLTATFAACLTTAHQLLAFKPFLSAIQQFIYTSRLHSGPNAVYDYAALADISS